jgi:16S rRNA (guanine966-N2)-methyltransferase
VRVVAGTLRGRHLQAPPGQGTRPTSDRVREAVFSSLESHVGLAGAAVVDLFAGSGALGIEALSRGASRALFVERDARAAAVIARNLELLGLTAPGVTVRRADALTAAGGPEVAAADVVFADPPYAFDGWTALLTAIRDGGATGIVAAETGAPVTVPAGWVSVREKVYGSTVVTMLRPLPGTVS